MRQVKTIQKFFLSTPFLDHLSTSIDISTGRKLFCMNIIKSYIYGVLLGWSDQKWCSIPCTRSNNRSEKASVGSLLFRWSVVLIFTCFNVLIDN